MSAVPRFSALKELSPFCFGIPSLVDSFFEAGVIG